MIDDEINFFTSSEEESFDSDTSDSYGDNSRVSDENGESGDEEIVLRTTRRRKISTTRKQACQGSKKKLTTNTSDVPTKTNPLRNATNRKLSSKSKLQSTSISDDKSTTKNVNSMYLCDGRTNRSSKRGVKSVATYEEQSDDEDIIVLSESDSENSDNEISVNRTFKSNPTRQCRNNKTMLKQNSKESEGNRTFKSTPTRQCRNNKTVLKINSKESEAVKTVNGEVCPHKNSVRKHLKTYGSNAVNHTLICKKDNNDKFSECDKDKTVKSQERRKNKIRPKEDLDDPLFLNGKVCAGEIIKDWKSKSRGKPGKHKVVEVGWTSG